MISLVDLISGNRHNYNNDDEKGEYMKLVMKGSTGCEIGAYNLGVEGSEDFDQNLIEALRNFATFMQVGDSLEVVATCKEEELV